LSTESKEPKVFYGHIVVAVAFFILAVAWGTIYSFGVFFKPVLAEFGWTRAMISGAYTLYQALHGFLYIFAGRLTDRFGPRLVVTICGLFFGLGFLLMSQISAIWQVYLLYGVAVAVGASGVYVPLVSTVARWFAKRRGLMTGIAVSGIGIGTIIIPPVASWLISNYGWRNSYIIIGCVALVVVVIAAQFLRRDPGQVGQLPYGAEEMKLKGSGLEVQGFSLRRAIRTGQFWIFGAMLFLFHFSQQTVMVHIVPHATDLGVPAVIAAGILSIIGGLSIMGRVGMGSVGDRIGNKPALIIVFTLASVALFWLLLAKELWMFYLFAIIFGFAYGGEVALMSPTVAELFGLGAHGEILGTAVFGGTIGGAIGPLVAGHIFDITNSYQPVFLLCVVLSITGLALSLLLYKIPRAAI